MSALKINRTFLPIKGHYVLFWGGLAGVAPFIITMLQLSVSASIIGILYAVLPFIKMISKPVFGALADKFQLHRAVFLISKVVMTSALFVLYFLPIPIDEPRSSSSSSSSMLRADDIDNSSSLSNDSSAVTTTPTEELEASLTGHNTYEFVFTCICMVIGWMCMAIVENTGDTIVLDLLGDRKRGFGWERLWGSLSWGVMATIAGLLIDYASDGKSFVDFAPGFYILLSFGVLDVLVSSRVEVKKVKFRSSGLAKKVANLFRRSDVIIFTIQVFLVGCLTGVQWTFLIVHLNNLGANQLLIGLTMTSQCLLGEVPFFVIADWFIDRIGHANTVTLTLAVYAARFALYYLVENPWIVLAIEILQGITYGLFFTALATYASMIAPPGAEATVQGIEQAIFEGFGVGIGCLIAGFLFDIVGGARTFLYFGIVAAIFTVISLAARLWMSCIFDSKKAAVAAAVTKKRKTAAPNSTPISDGDVRELQSLRSLSGHRESLT